jgi:hypothetical protein
MDRSGGQQDDKVITPLDTPRDLGDPVGAHTHTNIDENIVAGGLKAVAEKPGESLVISGAAMIGDKKAHRSLVYFPRLPSQGATIDRPSSSCRRSLTSALNYSPILLRLLDAARNHC